MGNFLSKMNPYILQENEKALEGPFLKRPVADKERWETCVMYAARGQLEMIYKLDPSLFARNYRNWKQIAEDNIGHTSFLIKYNCNYKGCLGHEDRKQVCYIGLKPSFK